VKDCEEIADRLCISPRTVDMCKTNIIGKFGINSMKEAMRHALEYGIIQVSRRLITKMLRTMENMLSMHPEDVIQFVEMQIFASLWAASEAGIFKRLFARNNHFRFGFFVKARDLRFGFLFFCYLCRCIQKVKRYATIL
jgi:hypothetical protein